MDFAFPGAAPPVDPYDDDQPHRAASPQPLAAPANPFLSSNKPLASRENVLEVDPQQQEHSKPTLFSSGPPKLSLASISPTNAITRGGRSMENYGVSSYSTAAWSSSVANNTSTTPVPPVAQPPPLVHTIPASSAVSSDAWVDVSCPDAQYKLDAILDVMEGTVIETKFSSPDTVALRFSSVLQARRAAARRTTTLRDGTVLRVQHARAAVTTATMAPLMQQRPWLVSNSITTAATGVNRPSPVIYRTGRVQRKGHRAADRSFCERIWMFLLAVEDFDEEVKDDPILRSSKKYN